MFVLPKNESSNPEMTKKAASLMCEAFFNGEEYYKCESSVSRNARGKAIFGNGVHDYEKPLMERYVITKEVFDKALEDIKNCGYHVYRREWHVQSGINWKYKMVGEITNALAEDRNVTILF